MIDIVELRMHTLCPAEKLRRSPTLCGRYGDESMSEQKSPITDYVATDDCGGFFNLKTGAILSVDAMLSRYSRAELETVPTGQRHWNVAYRREQQVLRRQRKAIRRWERAQSESPPVTEDSSRASS